jgi:uncharacterized membrane protein
MPLEIDVQPETLIRKAFTLYYIPRIAQDSYGNVLFRLTLLISAFMAFRLMLLPEAPSLLTLLTVLFGSFATCWIMLLLLGLLRKAYGARGLLLSSLALAVLAAIIILL